MRKCHDVTGRVTSHTNALNGVTTYSETMVSNKLQKTVTNPDGGQRVENHYRDGRLEKVTGSATMPVRYDYGCEMESSYYRQYSKETKLDGSGNPTSEWTKTYTDGAGQSYKTVFAAGGMPPGGTPISVNLFSCNRYCFALVGKSSYVRTHGD
jgi:hypothetical protein